ncbi:DUF2325 domain-containing protein [Bacillus sp. OAE603]|uniref:DUF2325 domain-containing protein n=1 Tax=Gottfriedia sp. OAE603 TaxID=2663872 RepID=UPI00178B077F
MKKTKVAIIGGSQERSLKQFGSKHGMEIIFHDGICKKGKGRRRKEFEKMIKKADCVVIQKGAISHQSMEDAKDVCKELNKPLAFNQGFGVTSAIQKAIELVEYEAA